MNFGMALLANSVTNTFNPKDIICFSLCFCWARGEGRASAGKNSSLWDVAGQRKAG